MYNSNRVVKMSRENVLALLCMMCEKAGRFDPEFIAKRLFISEAEAMHAIGMTEDLKMGSVRMLLFRTGFLEKTDRVNALYAVK